MSNIQEQERQYIINTYNRQPGVNPLLVKGEGALAWDEEGKRYLDLLGGLAVNAVGHCHPRVVKAVQEQVATLIHTSNLYYTAPQVELARILVEQTFGGRVFFANSGAEANEAAIKITRKYAGLTQGPGRFAIITAERSFHGRTLATVTATGQEKYQRGFEPLAEGFRYATFNDLDSFARRVDRETAGIMIEPVQGEGGVYPAEAGFIQGLRELCDRENLLLIFDEVQCGMGRTGRLWGYENYGVKPDIVTMAKGLGGGLPIGVMLAREGVDATFKPGDHASTFGGNPVVCRAAVEVLKILLEEPFLEQVREKGELFKNGLLKLAKGYPGLVREVRGLGLIMALELAVPLASAVQRRCQERGMLINAIGENIIRFLPPLVITVEQLEQAIDELEQVLKEAEAGEPS
ncbi:MAG: aspartate aminotransferase family protein [Firmicutes bacterium]|nr:aspartate aminotransferase family protein [Bacillota bacterium]